MKLEGRSQNAEVRASGSERFVLTSDFYLLTSNFIFPISQRSSWVSETLCILLRFAHASSHPSLGAFLPALGKDNLPVPDKDAGGGRARCVAPWKSAASRPCRKCNRSVRCSQDQRDSS